MVCTQIVSFPLYTGCCPIDKHPNYGYLNQSEEHPESPAQAAARVTTGVYPNCIFSNQGSPLGVGQMIYPETLSQPATWVCVSTLMMGILISPSNPLVVGQGFP